MRFSNKIKGTLILLVIVTTIPYMFVNGKNSNDTVLSTDANIKDWTVLVYMCGDNNLEYFALEDLNEMEAAGGTTADVNIVAIVDRCTTSYETPEYSNDWSESRYYTIVGDSYVTTFTSPMNVSLGEQNMGDPQTLDDFINWGLTNYPSDKTALILWDHGGGLDGVCWDEDNGYDNLLVDEISTALEGYHFDFLGVDACVMGQFEVLYELKDYCDFYVASMLNEPGYGWDYFNTFSALLANPSMTAAELAQNACEDYVAFYTDYSVDVTLSAYNISAMTGLETYIDNFASELIDALDTNAADIFDVRMISNSQLFPDVMCDIKDFVENVITLPIPSLSAAASALDSRLDNILSVSESNLGEDPYGMWFFLPAIPYNYYNDFYIFSNQSVVDSYINYYYDFDFVTNTIWDNFLFQWKLELETLLPQVSTSSSVSDTLNSGALTYLYADLPDPGAGNAYQATLTMDAYVDFDLYLWTEEHYWGLPNGIDVYSENGDDDPEIILFLLDDVTRVFFLIYSYYGTGSYTLDIEIVEYNDDAYEENDYITEAAQIEVNTLYHLIYNDADFFYVELTSDLNIEITLTFDGEAVDLDLYLYEADQSTVLIYSNDILSVETIDYVTSYTGLYYIEIYYYEGYIGEPYDLEVTVNEDPVITTLYHSPYSPEPGDNITITCTVSSLYSIVEVTLSVSYDGGAQQYFTMVYTGSAYSVKIAPPTGTEEVVYSVYVEDSMGNSVVSNTKNFSIKEQSNTFTLTFPWILLPFVLIGLVGVSRIVLSKKRY